MEMSHLTDAEVVEIMAGENIIVAADPVAPSMIQLTYSDGVSYLVDFAPFIREGGVMKTLADPAVFQAVKIGWDGACLEFPGEVDFCADGLRVDAINQQRAALAPVK